VATWLESIKTEVAGSLSIQWKAFSLEQQNSKDGPDFMIWEHPEYHGKGVPALAAAKAAKNQGDSFFLKFHLAVFEARHDKGKDIADRKLLQEIAQGAGLDLARFEHDLTQAETWRAVGKDHLESRQKYEVFGVPTLIFESGLALFVKLGSLPESREERISLFELIYETGNKRSYIVELKRP